jgi:hypothetical protein
MGEGELLERLIQLKDLVSVTTDKHKINDAINRLILDRWGK